MKKINKIPKFKNEDEERTFWAKADTTKYFDLSKRVKMDVSKLKPSTKVISMRVSESLLQSLKRIANQMDVPYQSLAKTLLQSAVERGIHYFL